MISTSPGSFASPYVCYFKNQKIYNKTTHQNANNINQEIIKIKKNE